MAERGQSQAARWHVDGQPRGLQEQGLGAQSIASYRIAAGPDRAGIHWDRPRRGEVGEVGVDQGESVPSAAPRGPSGPGS